MSTRERYVWGGIAGVVAAACFVTGLSAVGSFLALWAAVWLVYAYKDGHPQ